MEANNKNLLEDDFLRNLMQDVPHEKAPHDLSFHVMQKIYNTQGVSHHQSWWDRYSWWIIVPALAALAALLLFFDWPFLTNELQSQNINLENYQNLFFYLEQIVKNTSTFIHKLSQSSIYIILPISLFFLFLLDKLLKHYSPLNKQYLL